MIELSLQADFNGLERALLRVSNQVPFAAAQALNDCTRAASVAINGRMGETFDRPTPFTTRAVVAPRTLAATKEHLVSTVTVRPLQAKYLLHEEVGGTRTPAENTRRTGAALALPGRALLLDDFGNIPAGTLRKLKALAKPAGRRRRAKQAEAPGATRAIVFLPKDVAGNKAGIGGYFERKDGHRLTRLTAFAGAEHYKPRMHYADHVRAVAEATWPGAMRRRLLAAIASAR